MRVICIHPLAKDDSFKYHDSILKGLIEDECYYLYEGYEIHEDEILRTEDRVPKDLFNPRRYAGGTNKADYQVDICAIVGENGCGKSSLIDIYIRVINNLAAFILGEEFLYPKAEHLHFIKNLFAEVYVEIDRSIFCIRCQLKTIEVLRFDYDEGDNKYVRVKPNLISEVVDLGNGCSTHPEYLHILQGLCYNTILNYSLHSFNSIGYREEDTFIGKEVRIRKRGFERGFYRPKYLFDKKGNELELTETLLNENYPEGKSWLSGVFHKNDGFQSPIVISPKRDYGMIDINNENKLSEDRLLSLLFVEDLNENKKSDKRFPFSEINQKLRIDGFAISQNTKTVLKYSEAPDSHPDLPHYSKEEYIMLRDYIRNAYDKTFHIEQVDRHFREPAINYLVAKTVKIFMTYPRYMGIRAYMVKKKETLLEEHEKDLKDALEQLWTDYTHITVKLRRTLNYLRYDHIEKRKVFQTSKLAEEIDRIIEGSDKEGKKLDMRYPAKETDEMLPPPIFNVDFHVYNINDKKKQKKIPFSKLSSGEKQITYILCSLFYYMLCIDSSRRYRHDVKKNNQIEYKHINVIFDEIELYFHPDMQRTFISTLMHGLQQLPFIGIKSLHFMIVTHSPFVLSDIPVDNILFLEKNGKIASKEGMASFGANIHTMLVNNFFLKGGAMGAFAKETINRMVDALNMKYLWEKREQYKGNVNKLEEDYYTIWHSLPLEMQSNLENGIYDQRDIDWGFMEKMTDVIQEPIVKQRLMEIIRRRKSDVDA